MDTLKGIIAACATAVTMLKIYIDGDGMAIAALFGLYGVLLGVQIQKGVVAAGDST